MDTDRLQLIAACVLTFSTVGCNSVRQQVEQAFQEVKAARA